MATVPRYIIGIFLFFVPLFKTDIFWTVLKQQNTFAKMFAKIFLRMLALTSCIYLEFY
jgi:hypothetical protein